ncbi:hypothetical protein GGR57DRAFT_137632 [Xylariaceae sp. FL1272]|nr:hypothetical protein GGR57DRAFT_137632 [Xylariaceae sp. FL1272]
MINPRSFRYSHHPHSSPRRSPTSPRATPSTDSSPSRKDESVPGRNMPTSSPADIINWPRSTLAPSKSRTSHTISPPSNSSTSTTMATVAARPIVPSTAVQIPVRPRHKSRQGRDVHRVRSSPTLRAQDVHQPEAIPPAVAALLAITNIPPPNRKRSLRRNKDGRMTVDSIVPRSRVSEKELSQELSLDFSEQLGFDSFDRSPLEVLLSPPDELEEDVVSLPSDSGFASPFSTRTGSFDSLPSLGDSAPNSAQLSVDFPITPRRGKLRSPRRSLQPVHSPPGEEPADPLSKVSNETDGLDFSVLGAKSTSPTETPPQSVMPFRSVFKSNLTASLRALRSAARSISSFTASSTPPDDFLTRSILTIDPRIPFTDERRPPVLEEEPSDAMRRYLNPTSTPRPDTRGSLSIRAYTASIQMQTYKVQRSRVVPKGSRPSSQSSTSSKASEVVVFPPGPRQREMRENSDFIRIALMEHLMRKQGKLDDQREGHARWLLPPRKAITKTYEIGPDGVPMRWTLISQAEV